MLDVFDVILSTSDRQSRMNFPYLYKSYFDALQAAIRRLGSNPEQFITFEEMIEHLKLFGKYGCTIALFAVPMVLPYAVESNENSEGMNEWRLFKAPEPVTYRKRINELVEDCLEMGFLQ